MVHWSEGHPREHAHDSFPPHDEKPVRAFIAIRMNQQVEEQVASTIERLKRPGDGVRWTPRANLHVTLKFLGAQVDTDHLERITESLHGLASRTARFEVVAREVGGFPDLSHPRAIWIGLHGAGLGALAARIEAASVECGFERDNRRWNGHLTIGRVHQSRPLAPATRAALSEIAGHEFGISMIESITLYRSHPGPEGSTYQALATFLFQSR
jgi:2'-5' RNA ligase